ncbi:AAA family ATPase [Vibrio parahaemolyticus]|nr:AAA family ATPase [Vibrio parahaemolyticus]HAV1358628.1 ATP-binding protein [Vibrio parahaemolyticus]HAV1384712.1 ATP-binding protein [Vibrio parahaemolyticus]
MELTLAPNLLYDQPQTLHINKVATLIGENGSGKSSILQSVFEERLNKRAHHHLNVVCFSSGQNENYSEKFGIYLKRERKAGRGLGLECLYFDKPWSKLLIFLATATKRSGKVRSFLRERGYVTESTLEGDDQTTCLKCAFKIDKNYVNRVQDALKREENGEVNTLRNTPYFRSLDSFISTFHSRDYEFEQPLRKRTIEIPAIRLIDVSFDYPRQPQAGEEGIEAGEANNQAQNTAFDPEVSFFTQAADNDYFIDKKGYKLVFKGGIELDQLSDGEYQLLFLYALIDLFDSPNTLFLLDEADSHLHFKNVERLWEILKKINGYVLTTSHLLDSISQLEINDINVVSKSVVSPAANNIELNDRLKALSSISQIKFKECSLYKIVVLVDHENDWDIFKLLVLRKLSTNAFDREQIIDSFKSILPVRLNSGWNSHSESFAEKKMKWVSTYATFVANQPVQTTNVILICDRDSLPYQDIGTDKCSLAVQGVDPNKYQINNSAFDTTVLAWQRREIKHYLLSYSAMNKSDVDMLNTIYFGEASCLRDGQNGDYKITMEDGLCSLLSEKELSKSEQKQMNPELLHEFKKVYGDDVKPFKLVPSFNESLATLDSSLVKKLVSSYIENTEAPKGFNLVLATQYIEKMKPAEISEDITKMYQFIKEKLR